MPFSERVSLTRVTTSRCLCVPTPSPLIPASSGLERLSGEIEAPIRLDTKLSTEPWTRRAHNSRTGCKNRRTLEQRIAPRYEPRSYIKENKVNARNVQPDSAGLSSSCPYWSQFQKPFGELRITLPGAIFGKLLRPR